MSVILCRKEQVKHPFFMESLGVHIYTSQEMCYAMYHHPLLILDGFLDQNFVDFVRDELDMGFTALKMERFMKRGENPDELVFLFMQECGYYTTAELNRLRQKIAAYRKLPAPEYARQKADYLFSLRQYGKAMDGYEKILEDAENKKAEDGFLGAIWYNLGACQARVFQFAGAMEAFDRAYGKLKSLSVLKAMYHVTRMDPSLTLKERYQSLVTEEQKAAWDADFEKAGEAAACSEAARRLEDLFGRDPIRRQEGIRQQVEEWKQEYRAMA